MVDTCCWPLGLAPHRPSGRFHRRRILGASAVIPDQTFNCIRCCRTFLSRIGLVSHQHPCSQRGQPSSWIFCSRSLAETNLQNNNQKHSTTPSACCLSLQPFFFYLVQLDVYAFPRGLGGTTYFGNDCNRRPPVDLLNLPRTIRQIFFQRKISFKINFRHFANKLLLKIQNGGITFQIIVLF